MDEPYNLLIADDEQWERKLVKSLLSNRYSDRMFITVAKNGKEAINICQQHRMDIVIMDISMPILDGLGAIKEIKNFSPHIDFIMLTAFSEFDYAQKALNLGVSGYLLKPVEPEKLYEKIDSLIEKRVADQRAENKTRKLEHTINQLTPLMKSIFYQKLLFNQYNRFSEIEEYRDICGVHFIPNRIAVASISRELAKKINNHSVKDLDFIIFEEKLIMFGHDQQGLISSFGEIEKELGVPLKIGVGKTYHSPLQVHLSYVEALQAKAYVSLLGKESLVLFEDIPKLLENANYFGFTESKRLISKIKRMEKTEAIDELNAIINYWTNRPVETVKAYAMELLYLFTECMYDLDFEEEFIERSREQYYVTISNASFTVQIILHIKKLVNEMLESIESRPRSYQEGIIEDCKTYIQDHYMKDIGMTDLSKKLHVNPSYLSKLFKRSVGINFVDYINNLRINRAKLLLTQTNSSIDEISSLVGFNTHKYFSYVFKKYTKISPSEYRSNDEKGGSNDEHLYSNHH
jgi:two-component system response regulator YesN